MHQGMTPILPLPVSEALSVALFMVCLWFIEITGAYLCRVWRERLRKFWLICRVSERLKEWRKR